VSLRRRLALALIAPAVLVIVELVVGWTAMRADRPEPRWVLVAAAALALLVLGWVVLGWSRRVSRPLNDAAAALRQTLREEPDAPVDRDEVAGLRGEVDALLSRLAAREQQRDREFADLLHQRDLALSAASDGVVLLDAQGRVQAANATARAVLGEAATTPGADLARAELAVAVRDALLPLLEAGRGSGRRAPRDPWSGQAVGSGPAEFQDPGAASALREITLDQDGTVAIYRPERHDHGRLLVLRDVTDEHRFAGAQAAVRELVLEPRPVCLVELLQSTLEPLARQAHEQGVTLHLPDSDDRQVLAVDPVKFPWVITVIVGNALRYTGRLGEVTVEVHRTDEAMVVAIRDTGAGMAPEQLDRIFAPEARPDGRLPQPGSQGLALAIAREIVIAHGGRLEADSRRGIGTEVRLLLPLNADLAGRSEDPQLAGR